MVRRRQRTVDEQVDEQGVERVGRGSGHDQRGWVGKALVSTLTLVLAVAAVGAWRLDLIGPWYHHFADRPTSSTPTTPAQVAPPPGLTIPAPASPAPVASPLATPGPVDPAAVRAALAPYLADHDLGRHVVAAVADLSTTGPAASDAAPVVTIGHGTSTPASTTKLLTTTAALETLGPETRFTTRVVSGGPGRVVLVGGGDPLLASKPATAADPAYPPRADVTTLAQLAARKLLQRGVTHVSLGYDDSLFSGPTADPAWPAHYGPDGVVAPITALWVDEGRPADGYGRVADPSLYAAQTFAAALTRAGVSVDGVPQHGVAGSSGRTLAEVRSAPLREIVEHTLEVSDNEAAEVLGHQVGLKVEGQGSFAAGVHGVLTTLQKLGVPQPVLDQVVLHDGSGLSRRNRVPPAALVAVLQADLDPAHPELQAVADGLPVAGFTGSLTDRFDRAFTDARGLVHAKTGTLTNVSSLAGLAVDQQGHEMVFALMADKIPKDDELKGQDALDVAAGALGACSCGAP